MGRLKHDDKGRSLFIEFPQRALLMESATNTLWEALKRIPTKQLEALQPTREFVPLIDTLIYIRTLMGEDTPTATQIEDFERKLKVL